jgi:hypothetical protein
MAMLETNVSELEHGRSILLRVIRNLPTEQLDFLVFPDSKSVGETLLHVAGFEFLMVSTAGLAIGNEPDFSMWQKLKSGFSREARFAAPRGYGLDHYLEILADVRERTLSYFGEQTQRRLVAKATFPIVPLATLLWSNDPEADAQRYEKLATGLGNSFSDDGAMNNRGETDLIHLLQLHETYHRGQITLQKYIYARLNNSNGFGSQLTDKENPNVRPRVRQ